jgi:hypothetical protein
MAKTTLSPRPIADLRAVDSWLAASIHGWEGPWTGSCVIGLTAIELTKSLSSMLILDKIKVSW